MTTANETTVDTGAAETRAPAVTIDTSDAGAMAVYRRAFPEAKFRAIAVREFRGPVSLNSFWDSGYRDYFAVITLDGSVKDVPQNGTPFDGKNLSLSELPEGCALAVRHYAGTRQYGTLYLNAANITRFLPAPGAEEMPWEEKAVLAVTCGLKSFARREEAARMGIGAAEWETAAAGLKAKRLLNAAGAITNDGRNLVRTFPGCSLGCGFAELAKANGKPYRYY